jgi:hypothetical protein
MIPVTFQPRLEQWAKTRSLSNVSHVEKRTINDIHKQLTGKGVNTSCGSCLVEALDTIVRLTIKPLTTAPDFDSMNHKQLQAFARENNIPTRKNRIDQLAEIRKSF